VEDTLPTQFRDPPLAGRAVLPLTLLGIASTVRSSHPDIDPGLVITESLELYSQDSLRQQVQELIGDPKAFIPIPQLVRAPARGTTHRLSPLSAVV